MGLWRGGERGNGEGRGTGSKDETVAQGGCGGLSQAPLDGSYGPSFATNNRLQTSPSFENLEILDEVVSFNPLRTPSSLFQQLWFATVIQGVAMHT